MSALISADLHLSDNPRDAYRHKFLTTTFLGLVKKHKVDLVIIGGDLTESKDNHSAQLVNSIVDFIYQLSALSEVVILRGNHDYLNPDFPFYRFLRRIEGVSWINQPYECKESIGNCLYLPHTNNYERDWKRFDFSEYDWIFSHNTFAGAVGDNGFTLEGIPIEIFPANAKVISGDIHKPQTLGPVTYVGAPTTIDFGDDYDPRVLLIEQGRLKSIPCEGPQKRVINLKAGIGEDWKPVFLKSAKAGDIVRVKVKINAKTMDKWAEIKSEIRQWCERYKLILHDCKPEVDLTQTRMTGQKVAQPLRSDEQIMKDYSQLRQVHPSYLDTGLELMKES